MTLITVLNVFEALDTYSSCHLILRHCTSAETMGDGEHCQHASTMNVYRNISITIHLRTLDLVNMNTIAICGVMTKKFSIGSDKTRERFG